MSGKLRMYNVQFGDAFLLNGEGENLLVDFGSIQEKFPFERVRDLIRDASVGKELSLLLTHFHKDHWAGLRDQSAGHRLPVFKRVYLPDIFHMRFPGELDVVVRCLLSDFLEAVVLQEKPRFSLANLLRQVLPSLSPGSICFLSRGMFFSAGSDRYEVLWPSLTKETVVGKRPGSLQKFLKELDGQLAERRWSEGLVDTMEAMANVLLKDFAQFSNYGFQHSDIPGEQRSYDEIYDLACRMGASLYETAGAGGQGSLRRKAGYYAEQLSQDWNRVSLVFHGPTSDGDWCGGLLMTGDITESILTRLANGTYGVPGLRKEYDVIKAPHHGTKSKFCAILPRCRYVCISNGEGNSGYHKISEQYEHVYGCLGKCAEICCTNPRCEFIEHGGECPFFMWNPTSLFYDICW